MPRFHVLGIDGAWVNGGLWRTERGPETVGLPRGFLVDVYILESIIPSDGVWSLHPHLLGLYLDIPIYIWL